MLLSLYSVIYLGTFHLHKSTTENHNDDITFIDWKMIVKGLLLNQNSTWSALCQGAWCWSWIGNQHSDTLMGISSRHLVLSSFFCGWELAWSVHLRYQILYKESVWSYSICSFFFCIYIENLPSFIQINVSAMKPCFCCERW